MDYRGFGLSAGPWGASAAPSGDGAVVYQGFRASRFAADAFELAFGDREGEGGLALTPATAPLLVAHSYGNAVALALLSLYDPPLAGYALLDQVWRGMMRPIGIWRLNHYKVTVSLTLRLYALLDQSPRPMSVGRCAADASFPSDSAVFDVSEQLDQMTALSEFVAEGGEGNHNHSDEGALVAQADYPPRRFHYPYVAAYWNSTFKSVEELGDAAAPGCCVCYSRACMREWAASTDYWYGTAGTVGR